MIISWIYRILQQRAFEERQKVIQLEWKKAELEHKLDIAKKNANIKNNLNNI